jgi:antitoxin component of MazEF toxin-antitoxin module
MSHSIVGKWGKNLAIRVPMDVARASGLADGEAVEVAVQDGDIVVRRQAAHVRARQDAELAAAEIISDSSRHSLRGISIRELLMRNVAEERKK